MKQARFYIFLNILALILMSGCGGIQTGKSQAQWKVVVPQTLFAEKLRIAAFFDESFGLTGGAGDIGKAKFTSDGGKSWIQSDESGG